jgi:hypothetical protein
MAASLAKAESVGEFCEVGSQALKPGSTLLTYLTSCLTLASLGGLRFGSGRFIRRDILWLRFRLSCGLFDTLARWGLWHGRAGSVRTRGRRGGFVSRKGFQRRRRRRSLPVTSKPLFCHEHPTELKTLLDIFIKVRCNDGFENALIRSLDKCKIFHAIPQGSVRIRKGSEDQPNFLRAA